METDKFLIYRNKQTTGTDIDGCSGNVYNGNMSISLTSQVLNTTVNDDRYY